MTETREGFVIRGRDGTNPEARLINIKDPWGVLRKVAGLDGLRSHDLRQAFASVAVSGGMSLPVPGALPGHKEARTTQRYAHLSNDPLKAAAGLVAGRISEAMKAPTGGAEVVPIKHKG